MDERLPMSLNDSGHDPIKQRPVTYPDLRAAIFAMFVVLMLGGCAASPGPSLPSDQTGPRAPSASTARANQQVLDQRPFANHDDFRDARRGMITPSSAIEIDRNDGTAVWKTTDYAFIDRDGEHAPESVNPSLWRQAALNNIHGLFKVTDGVYQIRGYDLADMSIIEGDTGWILVDPLTARETASKALLTARKYLGDKPVRAILFTHSHIDHFGGVQGILQHLSDDEKANLRIIAPAGFEQEATSENIIAGPAMSRRSMYMFGQRLDRNELGHVGSGLGKGPAFGTFGFAQPTEHVSKTGEELTVDGVPIIFQMVSGSEAPAEFTFYLPEQRAFCGAELVSHTLHNLYTLRGAKVRDARVWSDYIDEARTRFAQAEVYFGSHHWPIWGRTNIQDFLVKQRDTYKFIHDQTVRMMNEGATPREIAETLTLPPSLSQDFHNQGYYGTVSANAKAVYQRYMGWFTGNPAQLNPLPETESATRYVRMMGGAETVVKKARQEFDAAAGMSASDGRRTYRWLAELLNQVVFAEPDNDDAKQLLARVYDQLGYQSESGPWRDFYLTGAYELRHGAPDQGLKPAMMREILMNTPVAEFFDSMAVRLNADDAEGKHMSIKVTFTDLDQSYLLTLENSVLHNRLTARNTPADATLSVTRPMFVDLLVGKAGLKELLFSDDIHFEGSRLDLIRFFSMLDKPEGRFNIVTP